MSDTATDDIEWGEPVQAVVKSIPWASASIHVNKDGKPRMNFHLSEAAMNACGRPKSCDVQIAVKDDKTMIRLVFQPEEKGTFLIMDMAKGGGRINAITPKPPVPDGHRETETCEPVKKDKKEAIFILPLDAWHNQLNSTPAPRLPLSGRPAADQSPRPGASAGMAAQSPAPPPISAAPPARVSGISSTHPLNAMDYLRGKGEKISRMAGDWWALRGEKVPRQKILELVNQHRAKADLKLLSLDEIY